MGRQGDTAVDFWQRALPHAQHGLARDYLSALEVELLASLALCGELEGPTRHLIVGGGRRIRPLVVLGACHALGGNWRDAIRQAVAVEFIHTASLIHDDIIDRSPVRRGLPAVHELFGPHTALLAGDVLCFVAFEIAAQAPDVARLLARACREMCIGEVMAESLEAAEKKTASLFAAAGEVGARMAGAPAAQVERMSTYGRLLGTAYQLRDDQLDGEAVADPLPYAQAARGCAEALCASVPRDLLLELADVAVRRTQ
jgi:geranylgeranyl pyrophosphate synthase